MQRSKPLPQRFVPAICYVFFRRASLPGTVKSVLFRRGIERIVAEDAGAGGADGATGAMGQLLLPCGRRIP